MFDSWVNLTTVLCVAGFTLFILLIIINELILED